MVSSGPPPDPVEVSDAAGTVPAGAEMAFAAWAARFDATMARAHGRAAALSRAVEDLREVRGNATSPGGDAEADVDTAAAAALAATRQRRQIVADLLDVLNERG